PSGKTPIIESGTVVKLRNSHISVQGTLYVPGTAADPVYFTSYYDDSVGGDTNNDGNASGPSRGHWGSIYVSDGGRVEMSHASIKYGGRSSSCWGCWDSRSLHIGTNGTAILDYIDIQESGHEAIFVHPEMSGSTAELRV